MNFDEFGFDDRITEAVEAIGFQKATQVQEQAIPMIMAGKDLLACAQTGTGKTAAFILPILDDLAKNPPSGQIHSIIIAPTRELAIQTDQQLQGLAYYTDASSLTVYGGTTGMDWEKEKKALTKGADIIIATPGKLISHLNLGYVKVDKLKFLVLDEGDKMLDMGFHDDIMKIISYLPKERNTLLFSATFPPKIKVLAKNILKNRAEVDISLSKPAAGLLQGAYLVYENQKADLLLDLLGGKKLQSVIVFCSTKIKVKELEKQMIDKGFEARALHSDLQQNVREEVITGFKNKQFKILIATDIASRGLDVQLVDLIVNYDVPGDAEDYVHRVGRTARAKASGVALTLISEKETRDFLQIEKELEIEIRKFPSLVGKSPEYPPKERGRTGKRNPRPAKSGHNKKR